MSEQSFVDVMPDDMRWGHTFGPGIDGVELHYVLHGNGTPILLLHGWPGFWYDWRYIIPLIGGQARLIAPDFRGFGDSDAPDLPPDDGYTPAVLARDLFSLLDHINIPRVVIAGYDLGATVAQEMARVAPERVRALALFNPPYPGIGDRWHEVEAERWFEHFHRLPWAEQLINYELGTLELYLGNFYDHLIRRKDAIRPAEFEAILRAYTRPAAVRASLRSQRTSVPPGRTSSLGNGPILPPTVVAWSDGDPLMPIAWADRLTEYFASVTLIPIPGVGHFIPIEAPHEAAAAIRAAIAASTP